MKLIYKGINYIKMFKKITINIMLSSMSSKIKYVGRYTE